MYVKVIILDGILSYLIDVYFFVNEKDFIFF